LEYKDTEITIGEKKDAITFSLTKRMNSGELKNTDIVKSFVAESFNQGSKWTYHNDPPSFEYRNINYYINGDKVKHNGEYWDSIAVYVPQGWGKSAKNIADMINKNEQLAQIAHTKGEKPYLFFPMDNWNDIKIILEYLCEHFNIRNEHSF